MRAVPLVQFRLQAIAFCEQRAVLGGEVVDEGSEAFPESFAVDASPTQRLIVDKFAENSRDTQPVSVDHFTHRLLQQFQISINQPLRLFAAVLATCES
jgi:hypothetical protein